MISVNGIPITDLMNKEEKSLDKNSFKDFALEHGIKYLEHEELSKHTSFKIGGPAEIFAKPSSKKQVSEIVDYFLVKTVNLLCVKRVFSKYHRSLFDVFVTK